MAELQKNKFDIGLYPRILLLLLGISLILLSLPFFTIYSEVSDRIEQDRQILITETTQSLLNQVDRWIDMNVRVLRTAARQPGMASMPVKDQIEILATIQQQYPWMYLVFTLDENGMNRSRSDHSALKNYSDRDYFRAIKQGAPLAWETLIGKTSGKPTLVLAVPVLHNNEFKGVIAAAMTIENISESIGSWQNGRSGMAVLVDEKNKIIAHPDKNYVLSEKSLEQHPLLTNAPSINQPFREFTDQNNTTKIGAVLENRFGWRLILEQDKKEAFRELFKFQKFMHLVFGSIVLTVLITAWLFGKISVSPFAERIRASRKREKKLETRLHKVREMEALGTFAGGIAHDFNNILGAITTCSEMAIEDVEKKNPAHEDLKQILKAAIRGKKLVKQILEYSRSRNTSHKPVKLHRILIECLDLFKSFKPDQITVDLNIVSKQEFILADPTQIHQMIMNLLLNAEIAMNNEPGTIAITLDPTAPGHILPDYEKKIIGEALARENNYLHLCVSDTGCGMPPEVLERMFDPFYTTRMNTGGTGLGLAMSNAIVKRHNGLISAESEVNQGTAFHVYLPCIGESEVIEKTEELETVTLKGDEQILFVDDDESMIYSISKMLRRLGYQVTTAASYYEALSLFKKNPFRYDLLITDRVMPNKSGVELAHDVRKIRPDLPIILCSGFFNKKDDTFLDIEYDIHSLVDEFVSKPFEFKPMSRIIRRVLDMKKMEKMEIKND